MICGPCRLALFRAVLIAPLLVSCACGHGQQTTNPQTTNPPAGAVPTTTPPTAQSDTRPAAPVVTLPTFAAFAGSQTELTIHWVVADPPAPDAFPPKAFPEVNRFEVLKRVVTRERLVVERDPQIDSGEIVLVAVDAQAREIAWDHADDPRIIRSEQPDKSGHLTGRVFYRRETEILTRMPDVMPASTLRIYEVVFVTNEYRLRSLGVVPVAQGRR